MATEQTKLVTIASKGSLVELGGITGPVINPCRLPVAKIVELLNGHKKVFEVNPNNKSEKIQLTLKNVKAKNFKDPVKESPKANVAPTVTKPIEAPAPAKEAKKETATAATTATTAKTETKKADKPADTASTTEAKSDFTKK